MTPFSSSFSPSFASFLFLAGQSASCTMQPSAMEETEGSEGDFLLLALPSFGGKRRGKWDTFSSERISGAGRGFFRQIWKQMRGV